jgi:hypothetical protein
MSITTKMTKTLISGCYPRNRTEEIHITSSRDAYNIIDDVDIQSLRPSCGGISGSVKVKACRCR